MIRVLSALRLLVPSLAARAADPDAEALRGNYGWGLPIQASTYAAKIDFGIKLLHGAMFLIFIVWGVFFTYLLIRYRRREGVPAETHHQENLFLGLLPDLAVMAFEILLIGLYAIPTWSRIKMEVPKAADANVVDVVAQQFAWNIQYPGADGKFGKRDPKLINFSNPLGVDLADPAAADDVTGANELHIPLGKPTLINLSSFDVIHSFFVPEFRIKQDAVPGMTIPVWVEPTRAGTYEIGCAQLCGFGHSLMRGTVVVQTPEDYAAWLAAQKAAAPAPPKPASPDASF